MSNTTNIKIFTPKISRGFGPYKLLNAVVAGRPLAGFRVVGEMGGAIVYDDGDVAVGGVYQGLDSGEGADCYVLIEKHHRQFFHFYQTLTQWYEGWHYWIRSDRFPDRTCDCQRERPTYHWLNCPGEHHKPDNIAEMPLDMLQSIIAIHPYELPGYFTRSIPITTERLRGTPPEWLDAFRAKGQTIFGKPKQSPVYDLDEILF